MASQAYRDRCYPGTGRGGHNKMTEDGIIFCHCVSEAAESNWINLLRAAHPEWTRRRVYDRAIIMAMREGVKA